MHVATTYHGTTDSSIVHLRMNCRALKGKVLISSHQVPPEKHYFPRKGISSSTSINQGRFRKSGNPQIDGFSTTQGHVVTLGKLGVLEWFPRGTPATSMDFSKLLWWSFMAFPKIKPLRNGSAQTKVIGSLHQGYCTRVTAPRTVITSVQKQHLHQSSLAVMGFLYWTV